jgi:hypothetical protein
VLPEKLQHEVSDILRAASLEVGCDCAFSWVHMFEAPDMFWFPILSQLCINLRNPQIRHPKRRASFIANNL